MLFKTTLFYLFCLIAEIWRNAVCIISIIVVPITIIVDIVEIIIIVGIGRAEHKNNSGDHVIIISTPISKNYSKIVSIVLETNISIISLSVTSSLKTLVLFFLSALSTPFIKSYCL